ncbi:LTA synthase family protein [Candidatus Uhrbacteria bacterium]|nr:LTA synthase family protein [Candidatus Uhrbacteria bacterium]
MTSESLRRAEGVWLPLALISLFTAQNFLFNRWFGIYPGQFEGRLIFVALALGTVLFGPAFFLAGKGRRVYLLAVSILTSLIFCSEFLYYSYSGGFLQASAVLYAGEAVAVRGTIKNLLSFKLLAFIGGPLLVGSVWGFSWLAKVEHWKLSKAAKVQIALAMITLTVSGYGFLLAKESQEWGSAAHLYEYSKVYDMNMLVAKAGVVNYFLADSMNFLFKSRTATPEQKKSVEEWPTPVGKDTDADFGSAKGRNLIIIQVESLENSVMDKTVGGAEITPNLNRLAREGLYFDNYYTQVGPGNTADAELTTMNSVYPLANEVAFIGYADNDYAALPDLLKQNGYGTYALHGDVPSFWNRANMYPKLGYMKSFSHDEFTPTRPVGFEDLGDVDFFEQSLPKLKALPQPFMATLITLSSHTPFTIPADLQTLDVPNDHTFNWIQWSYLESIHYTDKAIGGFIDGLKREGLYENSLVVIFGDHGSFTDISDVLDKSEAIPREMLREQVPLIVLAPGSRLRTGTTDIPASHLDLYPMVSDWLGIQVPTSILGQDALSADEPVVVHRNMISGTVQNVMTKEKLYSSAADGVFEHGSCLDRSAGRPTAVELCAGIFKQAKKQTEISDIAVRGNLITSLGSRKTSD